MSLLQGPLTRAMLKYNLRMLRESNPRQVIRANLKTSLCHWDEITTSCTGGPYFFFDARTQETKAVSYPSEQFVQYFEDEFAPGNIFANLGIENCLDNIRSAARQCPCLQFICSGIARHSSWVYEYSRAADAVNSDHAHLFYYFLKTSIENLKAIEGGAGPTGITWLIKIEKDLTKFSFEAWPVLYETVFILNRTLIESFDRLKFVYARMGKIPSIVPAWTIRHWESDFQRVKGTLECIADEWIYLNPQIFLPGRDDARRAINDNLQASLITRYLKACNFGQPHTYQNHSEQLRNLPLRQI